MAEQIYTTWGAEAPRSGVQSLWRLAIWATLASVSVFFAVISAYSNMGARRAAAASSPLAGQQATEQETAQQRNSIADLRAQSASNAEEARRLSEAARALAGDRDQLTTRIAALERNLDGVTGSIKRPPPAPPNTAPSARPEAPMTTGAMTPSAATTSAATTSAMTNGTGASAPVPATAPPSAPEVSARPTTPPSGPTEAARSPEAEKGAVASAADVTRAPAAAPAESLPAYALGVDVGGAANFEGLRALWHVTKNNDPSLLDDFYPVVATRENSKTHAAELRLIVGPMPDAEAAAQLCVTLAAVHQYCQPVAFEGQRLSVADAASGKGLRHRAPATSPVTGLKVVPAYPTGK
jgi:hypothetical protein